MILLALALAGEIETLAATLQGDGQERLPAMMRLVELGSAEALAEIHAVLRPETRRAWWSPPDASRFAAEVGRPDLERLKDAAVRSPERHSALVAASLAVRLPRADSSLIVFGDDWLGSEADVWVAEVDAQGHVSPSRFAGWTAGYGGGALSAELRGETLVVRTGDGPERVLALAELARDSDGDTLSDLVEARLGTDEKRADSDGDGLPDGEDLAPLGDGPARDEREDVTQALLLQAIGIGELRHRTGPVFVMDLPPRQWASLGGPILPLTEARQEAQGGHMAGGLSYVEIQPPSRSFAPLPEGAPRRAGVDELFVEVFVAHNPPGYSYPYRLRRLGREWFIVEALESHGE